MDVPFGPFSPDAGENTPGICMIADGVQPIAAGYGPYPSLTVSGTATVPAGGLPRGLIGYQKADGTWAAAIGTATSVELKATDDTWTAIDTGLSLTSGDDRCFLRFGTKLLYTDTTQGLRAYDVQSGGAAVAVASAGAPRWMFECGNILFGLDCLDSSSARNNRLIRSSKFSDHTAWTGAGTDYQPLEGGGALLWGGKLSDTAGLVLQQRAVKLIQVGNVGGGALWGIQSISEEFGAVGARSCVAFDGQAFWLATDGFRKFSVGGGIERIGAGLVDQWFLNRVDQSDLSLVQGSIDPFRKNVMWRWKRLANSSTTVFEDIIGYNWAFKVWFTLTVQTTFLAYTATPGMTWDSYSGTWDSATDTWDSRALQGGQPLFGATNGTGKYGNFSGAYLAATLQSSVNNAPTTELISWATPIDDASTGTLQIGVKNQLSDATTWKTANAKTSKGHVPLRGRGLNIAVQRNITAGSTWSYARGVDYIGAVAGGNK